MATRATATAIENGPDCHDVRALCRSNGTLFMPGTAPRFATVCHPERRARGSSRGTTFQPDEPYTMPTWTTWRLDHDVDLADKAHTVIIVPAAARASTVAPGPNATVAVPTGAATRRHPSR